MTHIPIGYFFVRSPCATSVAIAVTAVLLCASIPGVATTSAANIAHGRGIAPHRMCATKFCRNTRGVNTC